MLMMHNELREIHMVGSRSREWRLDWHGCPPMAACGIRWAGWTEARRGYRFVRKRHQFAGLLVCDGGLGKVLIHDTWRPCGAGMAYLLPPGLLHAYHADSPGPWRICWVAMDPAAGEVAVDQLTPSLVKVDPRPLRSVIEGLQREVNGAAEPAAVQRWVELIRLYALRIMTPQLTDQRLWSLWEAVDTDPGHPWTLAELADRASTSCEHLRRLCQYHLRSSPMQHVTQLRMRRAAALLASTSQKVATVARAVGYDSPFAFSTAFRRHTRVSPADYRRTTRDTPRNQSQPKVR